MIDVDCETTGLQPWSRTQRAFLWTFFDGEKAEALFPGQHDAQIQAWFDRAKQEGARAWNFKFDRAFGEVSGYDIPGDGLWYDGMLEAHTVDERRSVALKAVATQLFGDDADDLQKQVKGWLQAERAKRKKAAKEAGEEMVYPDYSDVPTEIMEPYALEDVLLTRKVCDHYAPIIEQTPDLQRTLEFERKSGDSLYHVERRGLPASLDDYRKLELEVISNLERLEERVMKLAKEGGAGDDFNPASTPQIIEALKGRKADMSHMSQENGKLSADAENLRAVDDLLAEAILEFRSEYKVLSTYVRPMIGRHYDSTLAMYKEPFVHGDGRIHANYRQVGARTGRMSCSDPNMQNQPRDDLRLRYCIRAEPGYKLVACDLSNIEMVLFAAYAGEGRLLDAVRRGDDLHVLTAQMLGIRDRRRAGGAIESARQLGKTYNFSRIYGGGLRTVRRQFRCDMNQARIYKKRFDDAYPEVRRLTNLIEYRLQDRGYISDSLISGRRFRVDPRDSYKATNHLVQGTAASLLKYALNNLHADGVPVVALVHDEVIAHVPEKDAQEVKHLIIKRLTEHEGLNEVVPLRAEGDIVDRWSQAKKPGYVPKFAGGQG